MDRMRVKSKNNQYVEFSESVVARYKKTTVHALAGWRLNPHDDKTRVAFLLQSSDDNYSVPNKTLTFHYESDVIELYSDTEKRIFPALNRHLIENGSLVPYHGENDPIDMTNVFTDTELLQIIALRKQEFLAQLYEITSWQVMGRVNALLTTNTPKWKVDAVQKRLAELAS